MVIPKTLWDTYKSISQIMDNAESIVIAEQMITDMDIQQLESEMNMTDMDLRLLELEIGGNN